VFSESGGADFPRERVTALGRGQVAILDDFAKLTVHGKKFEKKGSGLRKSMGHAEELEQFVRAIRGERNNLLTWDDASHTAMCVFAAQESIRLGVEIDLAAFREALLTEADEPATDEATRTDALQ
jgi:predicted dehydrogenase